MRSSKCYWLLVVTALSFTATHNANADLLALYEGNVVNGPAAQVLLDSSGNGNHAVFQGDGAIDLTAGKTGGALDFPIRRTRQRE